ADRLREEIDVLLFRDRARKRFALLDDVVGEDAGGGGAAVCRVVDSAGRNKERASRAECHRGLSVLLEDDRAFENVADLFARMRVPPDGAAWLKLGHSGDRLVTGHGQITLLEHRAFETALLCVRVA